MPVPHVRAYLLMPVPASIRMPHAHAYFLMPISLCLFPNASVPKHPCLFINASACFRPYGCASCPCLMPDAYFLMPLPVSVVTPVPHVHAYFLRTMPCFCTNASCPCLFPNASVCFLSSMKSFHCRSYFTRQCRR